MRQLRIPIVAPHLASCFRVVTIDSNGSALVQFADQWRECVGVCGRCGDKVIVIREDCPGLQVPSVFGGNG